MIGRDRLGHPVERVRFGDDVVLTVPGHGGAAKVANDVSYLAVALRNAGSGLARLHGWRARAYPRDRQISPSSLLGGDGALAIDLLYGDQEGGQRAILRLAVTSWPEFEGRRVSVLRYWNIDRDDSR